MIATTIISSISVKPLFFIALAFQVHHLPVLRHRLPWWVFSAV